MCDLYAKQQPSCWLINILFHDFRQAGSLSESARVSSVCLCTNVYKISSALNSRPPGRHSASIPHIKKGDSIAASWPQNDKCLNLEIQDR